MNFDQPKSPVEQQANSQENATLLLIDRLSHSRIRQQVVDLIETSEKWLAENVPDSELSKNEDGSIARDEKGELLFVETPHVALSRERIEADYDQTLIRIGNFTDIEFGSEEPHAGSVDSNEKLYLGFEMPGLGKLNAQQWSIVEAHEKGHSMRPYHGEFFERYFSSAFDKTAIEFTERDYELILQLRKESEYKMEEEPKFEDEREDFFSYLFSGTEIAERMSQLKNYFGLRGDQEFTLDHLNYAREHYVKDTGLDNRMTPFLKAITLATQDEFVRLINCSGI